MVRSGVPPVPHGLGASRPDDAARTDSHTGGFGGPAQKRRTSAIGAVALWGLSACPRRRCPATAQSGRPDALWRGRPAPATAGTPQIPPRSRGAARASIKSGRLGASARWLGLGRRLRPPALPGAMGDRRRDDPARTGADRGRSRTVGAGEPGRARRGTTGDGQRLGRRTGCEGARWRFARPKR